MVDSMALERRNYKQLVETTVELASKVGGTGSCSCPCGVVVLCLTIYIMSGAFIIARIVEDLKDESEPYRKVYPAVAAWFAWQ